MCKKLVFFLSLAVLLGPISSVLAEIIIWTDAYPWSHGWSSAANWDPPVVPGPCDMAYINPPPDQGPVIDTDAVVDYILGPRYDSNSSQAMHVFAGNLTVNEDWRFGIGGTGTSIIYVENNASVAVNGMVLHRAGSAEIYISDSANLTVGYQMLLADSGSATLDISGEPNVVIDGDLRGADSNGGRFEVNISGGSLSIGGVFSVGNDGNGVIDINAGDIYVGGALHICDGNGTTVMSMSGGEANVGELRLAGGAGSAIFNMSGGSLIVRGAFTAPADPNGAATIHMDDGSIECGSFIHAAAYTMDMNEGVLIIAGDVKDAIVADINTGYIIPSCFPGDVLVDFNNVNPGRTTVWVVPYFNFEVVPNVVGMTGADANTALTDVGLVVGTESYKYSDIVPGGAVISQYPVGGTAVPVGTPIGLVISLGQPVVPDVVGMSEDDANTAITGAGILTIGTVTYEYSDTVDANFVISQNPPGGTVVPIGSAVDLVVSLGRPVVPDVFGMTEANATAVIEAVDSLTVGAVTHQFSNSVAAGLVVDQNPAAGTAVLIGSPVDLVISLGPSAFVPNVVDMNEADANSAITAAGLVLGPTITYGYSNTIPAEHVMSQDPAAGTEVPLGSTVDVVVSLGRPVVPNVLGMTEADAIAAIEAVDSLTAWTTYAYSDTVTAGYVISQHPGGQTLVDIGTTVYILVSLGQPVVPNVVGMYGGDAVEAIEAVDHLWIGSITPHYSNTIPADHVISQDPPGGTVVAVGSSVDLVVSIGPVIVPDVVGLPEADAVAAIEVIDDLNTSASYEYNDTIPAGCVISQEPVGGTAVESGTIVSIVVSLGRPVVPNVVGETEAVAVAAIEAVDSLTAAAAYEHHSTVPAGKVIRQDPASGSEVYIGSTVNITVSLGQPPSTILGANRLVELQNNDGGWDLPLDDGDPNSGSDPETFASVATGLAQAYGHDRPTSDPNILAALQNAKIFLLGKSDNFFVADGALAVAIDEVLGGTACADYVIANFYDPLEAGTYYDAGSGTMHDTASYIQALRDRRSNEARANLAAWDLGLGLYSANIIGANTTEWVAGVKAEIDELNGWQAYHVLGLAGAVLGLAAVDEDHDPLFGHYAAASNLGDLATTLAGYQLGTGGFTWHWFYMEEGVDEAIQETVYGLMALSEFDRADYLTEIRDAGNYLQSVQLATGGWRNDIFSGESNQITGEALQGIVTAVPPLGDFDEDGDVDLKDFAIFAAAWLSEPGDAEWNPYYDICIPADSSVDMLDFGVFVDNWLRDVE